MIQVVIGILIGAAMFIPVGVKVGLDRENYSMIKNCDTLLPRNEHCILIAVPEKGE